MARTKQTAMKSTGGKEPTGNGPPTAASQRDETYLVGQAAKMADRAVASGARGLGVGKPCAALVAEEREHAARLYLKHHFEVTDERGDFVDPGDVAMACAERVDAAIDAGAAEGDYAAIGTLEPHEVWACSYVDGEEDAALDEWYAAFHVAFPDGADEDEEDDSHDTGESAAPSDTRLGPALPRMPVAEAETMDVEACSPEELVEAVRALQDSGKRMRAGYEAKIREMETHQRVMFDQFTTIAEQFAVINREREMNHVKYQRIEQRLQRTEQREERIERRLQQSDAGSERIWAPSELHEAEQRAEAKPSPRQVLSLAQAMQRAFAELERLRHVVDILVLPNDKLEGAASGLGSPRSLRDAFMLKELSLNLWGGLAQLESKRKNFWALFQYLLMGKAYNMLKQSLHGNGFSGGWDGHWERVPAGAHMPFHGMPLGNGNMAPLLPRGLASAPCDDDPARPPASPALSAQSSTTLSPAFGAVRIMTQAQALVAASAAACAATSARSASAAIGTARSRAGRGGGGGGGRAFASASLASLGKGGGAQPKPKPKRVSKLLAKPKPNPAAAAAASLESEAKPEPEPLAPVGEGPCGFAFNYNAEDDRNDSDSPSISDSD